MTYGVGLGEDGPVDLNLSRNSAREIILHIGMPKSGSSAIQLFLHVNRELLSSNFSVNYPESNEVGGPWMADRGMSRGNAGWIRQIYLAPYDDKAGFFQNITGAVDALRDFMASKINESNANTTVFSGEWIVELSVNNYFWKMLREFEIDHKTKVKVVSYIRNPFSYIFSLYKYEVLCSTCHESFDSFLKNRKDLWGLRFFSHVDYVVSLASANGVSFQVFGLEDINDLTDQFAQQVLQLNHKRESLKSVGKTNRGPSYAETFFCRGLASSNAELAIAYGYERRDNLRFSSSHFPETNLQILLSSESRELLHDYIAQIKASLSGANIPVPNSQFEYSRMLSSKLDPQFQDLYDSMFRTGEIVGASVKHGYFEALMTKKLTLFAF